MKKILIVIFMLAYTLPALPQEMVTLTKTATIQGAGETLVKFPFDSKHPSEQLELFLLADTTGGLFVSRSGLDIESKPMLQHSNAWFVSSSDSTAVQANWADSLRAGLLFQFDLDAVTSDGEGIQLGFTTLLNDTFLLTMKLRYPKKVIF